MSEKPEDASDTSPPAGKPARRRVRILIDPPARALPGSNPQRNYVSRVHAIVRDADTDVTVIVSTLDYIEREVVARDMLVVERRQGVPEDYKR